MSKMGSNLYKRMLMPLIISAVLWCAEAAVIGTRIQDKTGIVQTFLSYRSAIGNPLSHKGEEGILVLSSKANSTTKDPDSELACDPVTPAALRSISGFPWVLLVRRGKCDFSEKLENAEHAGYTLVIIYNDQDDRLIPMNGDGDPQVKAVFVGLSTGETLKSNYLFEMNPTAYVTLTPYYTLPWHMYIVPFLIVICICFLLMFIFLVIKKVRRYQRRRRARLPPSKLKKLKIIIFSETDDYDMCAICLDDFEEGDKLRILPCNHGFHSHCIDPWLTKSRRVCPCCKQAVFPDDKQPDTPPVVHTPPTPSLTHSYESSSEPLHLAPNITESPDENTPLVRHV